MILGVADAVGVKYHGKSYSLFDKKDYAKIPDGDLLKSSFALYLKEVDPIKAESGDILMFRFDKDPQHVSFVVKGGGCDRLIHCYM